MTKVKITYYGHSCFKIEANSSSIVLDPYENGSVPGLQLPAGIDADTVSCSHGHSDHNAAHLIHTTGRKLSFKVEKLTVPHDHHNGQHRGLSDITFIELPDITVCHLGDLGRLPTASEYAAIARADVVLLPCAGYFTISSKEAAEVIRHLKKPGLKVLMHFREGNRGYDVQEDINQVMQNIQPVKRLGESSITVEAGSITDEIVTLTPVQ